MELDDIAVNLGICPHCSTPVHFRKTKAPNIFVCPLCFEKSKQHINGKVLFTKINFNMKDENGL